jgi:DNA-binding NtrC family response regulator
LPRHGCSTTARSAAAESDLRSRAVVEHPWRGNVRELRSTLERALLLAPGAEIVEADLFGVAPGAAAAEPAPATFREAKERVVADFERSFLAAALARHGGNVTKAAEEIGVYRQNLQQKMRELGLSAEKEGSER